MPRHVLTPEERARGHKLTREDRVKGAIAANRIRGARGGKAAHAKGTAHALTAEERRKGGLATAAKRRAKRERDLIALALPAKRDTEPSPTGWTPGTAGPNNLPIEISPMMPMPMSPAVARAFGASPASKLIEGVDIITTPHPALAPPPPLIANPFILSALKRFRLGPLSPLALTRSQRAQVDLMVRDGWLEVTGDSMLQLTGKGREAIAADREG